VIVEPAILAFLIAVYLGGAVINGLIGMGLAILAVNAVAAALDPKAAVVVMSLISPFLSGYQLLHNRAYVKGWDRYRSLVLWAGIGTIFGAQILVLLPTWAIALLLGAFTVQFIVDRLRVERPALREATARRLAPIAGLVGGTTNSALGASGPIIGSYLFAIGLRGPEFAFAISVVFFLSALMRVASLAALGQMTVPLATLSFVLLVPAMLGQHIGQRYQGRADPRLFTRIMLVTLLISSLNMLLQGGRGLFAFLGIAV
jgi:uncharacterized membrane protein YfcA